MVIALHQGSSWMPGWGEAWASGFQPDPEKRVLYPWISHHSRPGATILTPAAGFEDLSLLTGRALVGQFKQVPNRSADVQAWFERLQDLSGTPDLGSQIKGLQTRRQLIRLYAELSPGELERLSQRYGSELAIVHSGQLSPKRWIRHQLTPSWDILETNDLTKPPAAIGPQR